MKTLIALALVGTLTLPVFAEDEIAFVTPGDPVTDRPAITYADLIKQVIPDFDLDEHSDWVGTLPDGIRHIGGPDSVGEKPDQLKISYVEVRRLAGDGHKNIWVLADLNGGGALGMYTLLMVFDDSASPKLFDAAEVDTDQLTGFLGEQLRISASDEAIIVDSEHSNSSQTYQDQSLLFVYKGKLTRIAEFFAFGTRSCTYDQTEFVDVTATSGGVGFWPIKIVNTRSVAKFAESDECPEAKDSDYRKGNYTAVYRWNAKTARYETKSKELDRLFKTDQDQF